MIKIHIRQLAEYAVDRISLGESAKEVSRRIAGFLISERRTREVPKLVRSIETELELRGSSQVTITSAHEVSEDTKMQLATALGAKDPVFSAVIDTEVIGGVKARSGESEIDLTVMRKLKRFKQAVARGAK